MWTDCENTIPDIGDACFSKSCKRNSMVNYAKLNLLNGSKIFYYHTKSRLTTSSASTCVSERRTVKILSVYWAGPNTWVIKKKEIDRLFYLRKKRDSIMITLFQINEREPFRKEYPRILQNKFFFFFRIRHWNTIEN